MGAATEYTFGDDEQGTTTQEESIPSSFGAFGQFQISKMLTAGLYLNSKERSNLKVKMKHLPRIQVNQKRKMIEFLIMG